MAKMCKVLEVSRSGYYDWLNRPPSKRDKKHARILNQIKQTSKKHPTYGLDPIWAEVKESIPCSRGTVYRLMKKHNIRSIRKTKWKATTNSKHNLPIAPNLLNQVFEASIPNSVWVGDITYHWTNEGWLYTAIVKDLCTKEVVGHASDKRMTKELVIKALKMALNRTIQAKGLIFHSDRGSQYSSKDFRALLEKHSILQSMSNKGNPYDNAPAENFFSCLKCERTNFYRFETRAAAKQVIWEYIEIFYNRQRRHAALGWISPLRYKQQLEKLELAA